MRMCCLRIQSRHSYKNGAYYSGDEIVSHAFCDTLYTLGFAKVICSNFRFLFDNRKKNIRHPLKCPSTFQNHFSMKNSATQTIQKHIFAQTSFHKHVNMKVKGNVPTTPAWGNIWGTALVERRANRRHPHWVPVKHPDNQWIPCKMNSKRRRRQGVRWAIGFTQKALRFRCTKQVAHLYQPAFWKVTVALRRLSLSVQVLLHHPVLGPVIAMLQIKCPVKNRKYVPQPYIATQQSLNCSI